MNRVARWMIRLYPGTWRARYGDEMEALLSDTGADARVVGDLARGGMRMQMKAWPFPLLALVLGLMGMLVGTGIAFLVPNTYMSQATLRLEGSQSTASGNEEFMRLAQQVMSRASLAGIIQKLGIYRDQQRTKPLEDVIDEMRRDIHLDFVAAPARQRDSVFNIRFENRDRLKAQETVAALIAAFEKEASRVAQDGEHPERMAIVDIASLPARSVFPTPTMVVAAGLLAGLLMAVMLRAIFKRSWIRRRFAAVTLAIAMGVAGIFVAFSAEAYNRTAATLWTNHFHSTAVFILPAAHKSEADAVTGDVLSRTSLAGIAQDPRLRLYAKQLAKTPLEDVVQTMKSSISVNTNTYHDGTFVSVTFDYYDRFKAQQTVALLLAKFAESANRRLTAPVESRPAPVFEVLDQPSTPVSPLKPNRYLISGTSAICGVLLAGVISLLRRRWKPEQRIPVNP